MTDKQQSLSELSLITTEMVSTMVVFFKKKFLLWNKNLNKFCNVCSKPIICLFFKFGTGFFLGSWFLLPPLSWGDLIWKSAKFLRGQHFFLHLWGNKLLWGELKVYGGVIFVTKPSLFHFVRNSQHPEKWSVFFKNFLTGKANASGVLTCQ